MATALTLLVLAVIVLVLVLLSVMVVGIRQELPSSDLSDVIPSPFAVMVSRLLGLYMRRPTPTEISTDRQRNARRTRP